ncbi:MAG TPA: class IV adenylate cyclase [Candidatus Dormibacteraeota bacterium]|nr:class IV adenylate cyclase [Candidatus Dormibacteraeota bacterium]
MGYTRRMKLRARTKREIEIKLRVRDIPGAIAKLQRLGAIAEGRVHERNTLYDTPDTYFRRTGRLLRIRIETPAASGAVKAGHRRAFTTFKAPAPAGEKSRYKEKLETEMAIGRPESWDRTLRSLGFRPGFRYEKYRSAFRLCGLQICLDETPVGAFLEIEGGRQAIDRAARQLELDPGEYIRGTYWDLYAADCRRRGKIPKNMLFRT